LADETSKGPDKNLGREKRKKMKKFPDDAGQWSKGPNGGSKRSKWFDYTSIPKET
jgi:hypothetical protein